MRQIRSRYLLRLISLMQDSALSSTAAALVAEELRSMEQRLASCAGDGIDRAHCQHLMEVLTAPPGDRPSLVEPLAPAPPVPPGAPIGSDLH